MATFSESGAANSCLLSVCRQYRTTPARSPREACNSPSASKRKRRGTCIRRPGCTLEQPPGIGRRSDRSQVGYVGQRSPHLDAKHLLADGHSAGQHAIRTVRIAVTSQEQAEIAG
jgi:hypothetical protein